MSFTVIDCLQRSQEWHAARCGRLTGSRANDMLTQPRKGAAESITRRDLRIQLACERLTGVPQDVNGSMSTDDMRRGIEKEEDAFAEYEVVSGNLVARSGFIAHTELLIGCSLDGHIGQFDGLLELKCPKTATHLSYLREGEVPTDYLRQITHNLYVTGAPWCDFVSFDDRCPEGLRLFVRRVTRADVDLTAYELAMRLFLLEVEKELDDLKALAARTQPAGAAA